MMRKKQKDNEFKDDGRVIADMNVPGVRGGVFDRQGMQGFGSQHVEKKNTPRQERGEKAWTAKELFMLYAGSVSATLLYGLILFGGAALFMYFWLR